MAIIGERERLTDPRLMRLAQDDTKPWYRKPQLRRLYLLLVPAALGVEWTSGFDSSMLNSLQAVPSWANCTSRSPVLSSQLPVTIALFDFCF